MLFTSSLKMKDIFPLEFLWFCTFLFSKNVSKIYATYYSYRKLNFKRSTNIDVLKLISTSGLNHAVTAGVPATISAYVIPYKLTIFHAPKNW